MYFPNDDLETLETERSALAGKCQQLVQSYIRRDTRRDYKDSRAREFATQGSRGVLKHWFGAPIRCSKYYRPFWLSRQRLTHSRHAPAHRIPLYIPPYTILKDK